MPAELNASALDALAEAWAARRWAWGLACVRRCAPRRHCAVLVVRDPRASLLSECQALEGPACDPDAYLRHHAARTVTWLALRYGALKAWIKAKSFERILEEAKVEMDDNAVEEGLGGATEIRTSRTSCARRKSR